MSSTQPAPWNLRFLCMLCAALLFTSAHLRAQAGESDQPTSTATPASSGSRGRETQHQEAGSVEATAPAIRDRIFLRQAAANRMLALKVSELVQHKSISDEIKDFATHLIAEHSSLDDGLRAVAESQGVMLPVKLPPRELMVYERLNNLSGEEFDREYIRTVAEGEHRALRDFRSEAANTLDESLRTTVQNGTKLIRQQMVAADQIVRNKGVQTSRPAKVAASDLPQ